MARRTRVRDVLHAIRDVDLPAGKEELVQAAKRSGAQQDVVAALRGIPAERYANREEVAGAVRLDPGADPGQSPARRAGQSPRLPDVPKPPVEDELDR
ncbi:DUF2795 domain-containing protein [Streptomyces griseoloalbus]|uniref:DUF2795 domain-containing protein n=1 Tax=Streptomyces griseoloalbus TaxID=67303 RepID=A0ABV3E455_9ACTN